MKLFFIFILFIILGCVPLGKVIEGQQTARATGPADPPGGYASPGTKLALSPTSLSFATPDTTKTITLTTTDRFVHQKIFLCKTPCASTSDWTKIGEFDGTPVIGTYLDGTAGISKQFALSRDDLMDGNNFIVVFTCGGIGLCNGNKWLLQRFTARFVECNGDGDCSDNKKCEPTTKTCVTCYDNSHCPTGQKCNPATKTCVSCLADSDCSAGQKCINDACVLVCATPPESMVSWLAGDDTAKDLIRGTTALVQGATYDVGKVGKAFKFDGVDDEVVVLHRETLSFAQNAPMSIDAWIYRTGTGSIGHILGKRTACGSMNYQLAYDSQSGLHFSSSASVAASNIQPPLNTWTHIAGTFDGSLMKIYINGELKGTATGATLGAPNTDGVKIGASGTCSNRWKGLIDEVEVYNRALSAAEIKAIFDASTAGKCKLSTLPPACSPACIAPKKCDEILGSCVDCLGNADCSGKFCDQQTKTCVNCIDDASCLSPPNTVEDSLEVDASRSQDIYPIKTYTFDGKSYSIQAITDAYQATLPLVFKVNGKQMPGLQIGQSAFIDGLTLGLRSFSLITDSNQAVIIGYRAAYFLTTKTKCDSTTKTCIEKCSGATCPAGKKCNPTDGVCIDNCVGIICPTRQHCNPLDSLCIDDNPLFSGEPLLIAHWDMERIQNLKVRDVTGNDYEGTVPSEITITNGKNGNALSFPGNKGMEITKSIGVRSDRSFSVEIMFKPAQKAGFGMLFVNGLVDHFSNTPPQPAAGYLVDVEDWSTGSNPRFALAGSFGFLAGNIITGLPSLSPLPYTAWSHLVVTYNQPSNVITLYVNGNKITARTLQSSSLSGFNGPSYVGSRELGLDGFKGLIDDVKVYNGLLTDAMVKTHYTNS